VDTLGTNTAIDIAKIVPALELCNAAAKCKEATETKAALSQSVDRNTITRLEATTQALRSTIDSKVSSKELSAVLERKADKTMLEAVRKEVHSGVQQMAQIQDRTAACEREVTKTASGLAQAGASFDSVRRDIERLRKAQQQQVADAVARTNEAKGLGKLVHALASDAEMRCALDEEMTEMLEHGLQDKSKATGPTHIYGSHGWRNTQGSVTERFGATKGAPMPAGMGHKGAGSLQRDVLNQRRKLISSMKDQQKSLADQAAGWVERTQNVKPPRPAGGSHPSSRSSSPVPSAILEDKFYQPHPPPFQQPHSAPFQQPHPPSTFPLNPHPPHPHATLGAPGNTPPPQMPLVPALNLALSGTYPPPAAVPSHPPAYDSRSGASSPRYGDAASASGTSSPRFDMGADGEPDKYSHALTVLDTISNIEKPAESGKNAGGASMHNATLLRPRPHFVSELQENHPPPERPLSSRERPTRWESDACNPNPNSALAEANRPSSGRY